MAVQGGMSYNIRVEPGSMFQDQLLNLVRARKGTSERATERFKRQLPGWYDLWRGLTTGNFTPTKNNVWLPLIFSAIQSDVARKYATAFAGWPIIGFHGFGPDDEPSARKQEGLVNAQLLDADILQKEIRTFLMANLYGTAISQVMWHKRSESVSATHFKNLPLNSEIIRILKKERAVTFDGPNYKPIDLLDFFPQPGYIDINGNQGMQWCLVRYYLDFDECRFLASEAGGKVFDAAEVEKMRSDGGPVASTFNDGLMRRFEARAGVSNVRYDRDPYTRPVEIIEMWGTVPQEFASRFDGATNVVISVANDKYIMRAVETPFEHRQKPFVKYSPTPDPHYFFAPGKAEVSYQLQIIANRFINHQLDAADLLTHPVMLYNSSMGINPRNLWVSPGRLFKVDALPGQDISNAISPLPMDFRTLSVGDQMTRMAWQFMQMGTGVMESTVMGMDGGGSDRQTAREVMIKREASGTRLMLESVLYDSYYLEPLANMFSSMNKQFLSLPREVTILGDSAIIDPVTQQPIKDTRMRIDASVLNKQYVARAVGSTQSISRESDKANMLTMFQVLAGAQPYLAGAFNMTNFLRHMLRTMGFRNVNEIIQAQPQMQQMLGQQGMEASQMPGNAQGLLPMMGGTMPSGPAQMG